MDVEDLGVLLCACFAVACMEIIAPFIAPCYFFLSFQVDALKPVIRKSDHQNEHDEEQEENEPEPKWVPFVGCGFTKEDMFCVNLRRVQQRSGCSDVTCKDFLETFAKLLNIGAVKSLHQCDELIQEASGARVLRLHGCVGCHQHVWHPNDKETHCTHCGYARYKIDGKPFEVCMYV